MSAHWLKLFLLLCYLGHVFGNTDIESFKQIECSSGEIEEEKYFNSTCTHLFESFQKIGRVDILQVEQNKTVESQKSPTLMKNVEKVLSQILNVFGIKFKTESEKTKPEIHGHQDYNSETEAILLRNETEHDKTLNNNAYTFLESWSSTKLFDHLWHSLKSQKWTTSEHNFTQMWSLLNFWNFSDLAINKTTFESLFMSNESVTTFKKSQSQATLHTNHTGSNRTQPLTLWIQKVLWNLSNKKQNNLTEKNNSIAAEYSQNSTEVLIQLWNKTSSSNCTWLCNIWGMFRNETLYNETGSKWSLSSLVSGILNLVNKTLGNHTIGPNRKRTETRSSSNPFGNLWQKFSNWTWTKLKPRWNNSILNESSIRKIQTENLLLLLQNITGANSFTTPDTIIEESNLFKVGNWISGKLFSFNRDKERKIKANGIASVHLSKNNHSVEQQEQRKKMCTLMASINDVKKRCCRILADICSAELSMLQEKNGAAKPVLALILATVFQNLFL